MEYSKTPPVEIHPSMINGYNDCNLRSAVNAWPHLFESFGYKIPFEVSTAARGIGNGVHAAIENAHKQTMQNGGTSINTRESVEFGIEKLSADLRLGFHPTETFDKTSKDQNDCEKQLSAMFGGYYQSEGYKVIPQLVEASLSLKMPGNFVQTGRLDYYETNKAIDDIKTYTRLATYQKQFGGYIKLLRANNIEVKAARQINLKRVRPDKPTPPPVIITYDLDQAEKAYSVTVDRVVRDHGVFMETNDPLKAFGTNSSSILCSRKYCRVYGTDVCNAWQDKENLKGDSTSED